MSPPDARSLTPPAPPSCSDPTEGCFHYPLVETFLMTKRSSRALLLHYLLCRGLTFLTLLCACVYLGYYLRLAALTDHFGCPLRVGLLQNDSYVPDRVQCKLIAVGVFSLLRYAARNQRPSKMAAVVFSLSKGRGLASFVTRVFALFSLNDNYRFLVTLKTTTKKDKRTRNVMYKRINM